MIDWALVIGFIGIIPVIFIIYDRVRKALNKEKSPNVILEAYPSLRYNKSGSVVTYSLNIKNEGRTVAQGIEVRLLKAEQDSKMTTLENRYTLIKLDYLASGDSYTFTFISDYGDKLLTPAGQDQIFPRENGVFTFIITGLNFQLVTVKMNMSWDDTLNKYGFKIIE